MIAKSILVAWRTIQVATRTTRSRYCFMMMNKCNSNLRLYNETHEDIYGLAVNNEEKIIYHIPMVLSLNFPSY